MRRATLAIVLGGVLLAAGACSSDAKSTTTDAAPGTPAPSLSPLPDYTANTRLVCGKLEKIFSDDLETFGAQVGKMIAYKEAKQVPQAAQAQKAAGAQLKSVGTKVKKETETAHDPEVRVAGAASAAKFNTGAADSRFFAGIRTTKDLDRTMETKMAEWLNPVAGYCG